ncbi:MAG: hypothetical protein ABWY58_07095 [Aeromicrobium sp.]
MPAALLAVVFVAVAVRSITGGPPVDHELAAEIRTLDVTPYMLDLEGAELVDVDVDDDGVVLDYTGPYFGGPGSNLEFFVHLSKAPRRDICGNSRNGPTPGGGSWTCKDNRAVSSFEEMSSYITVKGDTRLSLDPQGGGVGAKAFAALDGARRVSADELARHSDGHHDD